MKTTPMKILIVDDEPDILSLLDDMLSPKYKVISAENAQTALNLFAKESPDIVITDMKMPGETGIQLMQKIRAQKIDIPVIMITGHGDKALAIEAIKLGAFDFIEKPFSAIELTSSVARAAAVRLLRELDIKVYEKYLELSQTKNSIRPTKLDENFVIAIGASFGGTEAILEVLTGLPANIPPIVIVQHLPAGFSGPFASQLNAVCPFRVKEAEDGEKLMPGVVLIAPSGKHFRIIKLITGAFAVKLSDEKSPALHLPNVDDMFESLGIAAGKSAIGIILTGMGSDGAKGLLKLRLSGGRTIAQNKESCTIFGMPAKAIELGGVEQEAHLKDISKLIIKLIEKN